MSENFIEKVTVKFDNTKPVEVTDFLTSIHSFRKEYESIVKQEGFKIDDDDMKLYIHVKEGCIQWEFIRVLWDSKPVQATLGFVGEKVLHKTWEKVTTIFSKVQKEESVNEKEVQELENAKGVLQPAKSDLGSKISYKYENKEEKVELNFEIQGASGRGIYDKIGEIISKKKLPSNDDFEDKILQLTISSRQNSTAIRGVIEDFDEKDYQIAFSKDIQDTIANEIKPFEGCYLVNGSVKTAKNKIVLYYITKIEKIET